MLHYAAENDQMCELWMYIFQNNGVAKQIKHFNS